MLFVDPDGLEVKLEFQDLVDQAEFLKQLERKTGLNLDVKDGFLGAVGTFTNNQGQQIGSEAARTALEAFIGSEAVFNITGVNGDPNVWGAQQGPGELDVTIDMADVSAIQAGGNGRATMDSAIIALHELLHTVGFVDPGVATLAADPTATGETVDFMNLVRRELGLPQRLQYGVAADPAGRPYIPFERGPVYLPPRVYGGSVVVQ